MHVNGVNIKELNFVELLNNKSKGENYVIFNFNTYNNFNSRVYYQ